MNTGKGGLAAIALRDLFCWRLAMTNSPLRQLTMVAERSACLVLANGVT